VERLKTLTGGLLSFSGGSSEKRCRTDLNQVLDDVLILLRYELNRKQISLVRDYAELPAVLVDSNAFKQVFINLILNAVQAMESGGTLTLSSHNYAEVGVKIAIFDTGPGIPEALRDKIFEPFFTSRKDGEGTGLGLYICRKIVTDHDGDLRLESPADGGCCFQLLLPATGPAPATSTA
jgi:signal transduction histidine kinase